MDRTNPLTQIVHGRKAKVTLHTFGYTLSPTCTSEASLATPVIFPTFALLFLPHFPLLWLVLSLGLWGAVLVHVWVSHILALRPTSFSPPFSHLRTSHRRRYLPSLLQLLLSPLLSSPSLSSSKCASPHFFFGFVHGLDICT